MVKLSSRGSAAPLRAIACMIGGSALVTANDALTKLLTGGYPVGQVMALRGLFIMVPIVFLVWRAGGIAVLRTRNPKGHLLRVCCVLAGTVLFLNAIRYLPLAEAVAISFSGPLFTTMLATPLLGERVGWRRWMAVLAGFAGVAIIFQPGGAVMQWASLLALAGGLTGALRDILTRHMHDGETSEALLAFTSFGVMICGFASVPIFGWNEVTMRDWGLFALNGLVIVGAHFLLIEAFRYGEAALVAPFKYSTVLWATLYGFLFFGDLPERSTLIGAGVVVASGLYILHRERRRREGDTDD